MQEAAKLLVWDWNGTLFDDAHALHNCINMLLKKYGRPPIDIDAVRAHCDMPFGTLYRNFGLTDEQIKALTDDPDTFHNHYEPLADQSDLRLGALDVLEQTQKKGVDSFILSNHLRAPIEKQLSRLGIEHFFSDVLAYGDRATQFKGGSKSERLRDHLKDFQAYEAVIVGDTPEEIHVARDLGLVSVAITGGFVSKTRLEAEKPDYLIHELPELSPILEERGFLL